jgi:N-glycosylase/DNA lyase
MKRVAASFTRERLDHAVRTLCPLVEERVVERSSMRWTESNLRRELVGCILGSQVRNETAIRATCNLIAAGLLEDAWWASQAPENFEDRVFAVLTGTEPGLPYSRGYRFPRVRARQLASVRDELMHRPLVERLVAFDDAKELRQHLILSLAGLGPKQASMFLRNTGTSFDLAILDTHVLEYMAIQDLMADVVPRVGTIAGYERLEQMVVAYADSIGLRAGYLDVAIWATMKAAKELTR